MALRAALLASASLATLADAADERAADVAFLRTNAARDEVTVRPSGLQYEVVRKSTRAGASIRSPRPTDQVRVHYKGTWVNGTIFDSSYDRHKPAHFMPNGLVPGMGEGLTALMKPGDYYVLYLPENLAYGAMDMGTLTHRALTFHVELLAVGDGNSFDVSDLGYGGTIASCGGREYEEKVIDEKLGFKMGFNDQYGLVEWREGGSVAPRAVGEINLLVAVNGERLVPGEKAAILPLVKGIRTLPRPVTLTFAVPSEEGEGTASGSMEIGANAETKPAAGEGAWKCATGE